MKYPSILQESYRISDSALANSPAGRMNLETRNLSKDIYKLEEDAKMASCLATTPGSCGHCRC